MKSGRQGLVLDAVGKLYYVSISTCLALVSCSLSQPGIDRFHDTVYLIAMSFSHEHCLEGMMGLTQIWNRTGRGRPRQREAGLAPNFSVIQDGTSAHASFGL